MVVGHLFRYFASIVVGGQFYWNHSNLTGSTQLLLFFCVRISNWCCDMWKMPLQNTLILLLAVSQIIYLIGFFVNQNVQHTISGSEYKHEQYFNVNLCNAHAKSQQSFFPSMKIHQIPKAERSTNSHSQFDLILHLPFWAMVKFNIDSKHFRCF